MTANSKQTERDGESVLSRWSRRKLESRRPEADEDAPPADAEQAGQTAADGEVAAAPAAEEMPVLTDADMPDIDSLDENSDFSPFMSSGVSDQLRNLALRKLFHTPVFNIRDGLNEYDEDYTTFEKLGDIITSDMKHRIEMEQLELRDKLAEEQRAADAAEAESAEADAVEGEDEDAAMEAEAEVDEIARLDAAPGNPDPAEEETKDEQ